jgi:hypothetical protein
MGFVVGLLLVSLVAVQPPLAFVQGRGVFVEYDEPTGSELAFTTIHYGYIIGGVVTHRTYDVAATRPAGGGHVGVVVVIRGPDEPVAVPPDRVTVYFAVSATTVDGVAGPLSDTVTVELD